MGARDLNRSGHKRLVTIRIGVFVQIQVAKCASANINVGVRDEGLEQQDFLAFTDVGKRLPGSQGLGLASPRFG